MLRAGWKSLWARKGRLLLSASAVVLGISFVVGSFVFTDTLAKAFNGLTDGTVGDVVVRVADTGGRGGGGGVQDATRAVRRVPGSLLATLAAAPGAARADGRIASFGTFPIDKDGKLMGALGAPGVAANYSTGPAAHGAVQAVLVQGRWPATAGEVVLDPVTFARSGYALGDTMSFVTSGPVPRVSARVVGVARAGAGSLLGASLVVFDTHQAQQVFFAGKDEYSAIWVTAAPGVSQEQLKATVTTRLPKGFEAVTGDASAARAASQIDQALSFVNDFLLIFGAIALFVGAFLIVNTFSILIAQRSRELALLRALGAARRQVGRLVLLEAAAVGLLGATIGLGVGWVLALVIRSVLGRFGLDLSSTDLVLKPRTVLAAYAVGLLVTLVAAYLPARRAGRVPPVAAMRDDVTVTEATVRWRVLVGLPLIALGALVLLEGVRRTSDQQWWLGGGILGVVLGVVLASPLLARPVVALLGGVATRLFGIVGRLARQNAARNPRRTAATASALMIGVTLVTMMNVFGASARASVDEAVGKEFVSDFVVSSVVGSPFSSAIAKEVAAVPGVGEVARARFFRAGVGTAASAARDRGLVAAVDASVLKAPTIELVRGTTALGTDGLLVVDEVARQQGLRLGDRLVVDVRGTQRPVVLRGTFARSAVLPASYLVGIDQTSRLGLAEVDSYLWVDLAPGADRAGTERALSERLKDTPIVSVLDEKAYAAERTRPIDTMLAMISALLGLAVVIAVLGILNTLALSVLERTREIGLLRAVGLSRGQLQGMLWVESVVIALLGALLGLGLGTAFGIALQRAMASNGITLLRIPWTLILAFVLVAVLVGILAALWPGRRAARLDVLRAVASE